MKSPFFVLLFLPLFQAPRTDTLELGAVSQLKLKKQPEKENFLVPYQLFTKDYDDNHCGGEKEIGSGKLKLIKNYLGKGKIKSPSEKNLNKRIGYIQLHEVKSADSEMGYFAMENNDIPKEVEDVMKESASIIHPNKFSSLEANEEIPRTLGFKLEYMKDLERITSPSLIHYIPRYVVEGPNRYFKLSRVPDQDFIKKINAQSQQEEYTLLIKLCEMKLKELSGKTENSEVESTGAKEAILCVKTLFVLSQTAYHGDATRTTERILNVMLQKPGQSFILDLLIKAYKLMPYKTLEEFRPFYEEYEVYLQEHPELLKYVPSLSNIEIEEFLNLVLQKIDLNFEVKIFIQKAIYYVAKLFERATGPDSEAKVKEILISLQLKSKDMQIIPKKFEENKVSKNASKEASGDKFKDTNETEDIRKDIKVLRGLLETAASILVKI